MQVIIAPQARRDIQKILSWTEEQFGPETLRLYAKLLATAIEQIAEDPDRVGSIQRPDIAEKCQTYHLFFSRKSTGKRGSRRILQPRHFLVYRVKESNIVEIGRILHDSMDLERNLPPDFRSEQE